MIQGAPYFIDVILPIPLERLFTYSITKSESDFLNTGVRVAVPFGKNKIYTALVYKIHQNRPETYEAKPIHQILDKTPIVNSWQLKLWLWISEYYMCTLGDVLRAALPSAFLLESETIVSKTDKVINDLALKDDEFLVYEALQHQTTLKIDEINLILDKKNVLPVLKRLLEKEIIKVDEELYEKYKPKLVRYVRLNDAYKSDKAMQELLITLSRAPKQHQLIMTYFMLNTNVKKPIKVSVLKEKSDASSAQIKTLIDKQIFEEYYQESNRIRYEGDEKSAAKKLNIHQDKALNEINKSFDNHNVTLLHGVTSSGKTEIYVKLIEQVLKEGKQVLYLVPEIGLTTQLVQRLRLYFGKQVSVYHSKYSLNERIEVWNTILKHDDLNGKVVLGARSSMLLPFNNLGLVIVDEEHEQSYKQFDPAPRYHARDAAIVLANLFKARTLLGSATPSVESYFNATLEKKYGFVELNRRYNEVLMPEISLVDIKDKHKRKRMKGHFSDTLIAEIQEALDNRYQIILFQNRRGYSPIVECGTCGHSPQCTNCDVSLTYHQYSKQLRCHYCGYKIAMLQNCLSCGSVEIDSKGFGTEQIEQEVKELFPDIKIARMDLDTTRGKYAYETIITAFENQEVQILVGTQMLTKGLDFRNVKLVGIMNADNMLNFPDFRAHECSFQLMQQVSGRAGRTEERGKVIIQTFNPYHNILQQVSSNDYLSMFKEQIDERYNYKYPPIYRLIKITLKHRDYNKVNEGGKWLAKSLRQLFTKYVLGPEFPPVARIRNQYHKNILIKIPQGQSLTKTKEVILKIKNSFLSVKDFRPIRVIINVDNY